MSNKIKDFLNAVKSNGVAVKSLFEVTIEHPRLRRGINQKEREFYITDIDLPGKKLTTSTLYRNGREYDIPIIYDNNREFTMTVLCDEFFLTYLWFEKQMRAGTFGGPGQFTIKIVPCTPTPTNRSIELQQVFFESLGSINFSHNSKELITFTVTGRFRDIELS